MRSRLAVTMAVLALLGALGARPPAARAASADDGSTACEAGDQTVQTLDATLTSTATTAAKTAALRARISGPRCQDGAAVRAVPGGAAASVREVPAEMVLLADQANEALSPGRAVFLLIVGVGLLAIVPVFVWGAIKHPAAFRTDRFRGDTGPRGPRTVLAIRGVLAVFGLFAVFGGVVSIVYAVLYV